MCAFEDDFFFVCGFFSSVKISKFSFIFVKRLMKRRRAKKTVLLIFGENTQVVE